MITKRQLKQMLQSLTERVERLEAKAELFNKGLEVCVDAHKKTLKDNAELSKRVDVCERFIKTNGFLIFALKAYLGVNHNDFKVFLKDYRRRWNAVESLKEEEEMAAQTALKKEAQEWAGSDAVEAYKAGVERGKQKESDLFSEPAEEDMWIDSKEARKLLGWQTISTSMLKGAGIRYQQPLGKHHKITAHKGDIENYIANRR